MREIELHDGQKVQVDDADYEWVVRHKWQLDPKGYVKRHIYQWGKRTTIPLAREIMVVGDDMQVDHIDGDKLNNQRSNLRCVCNMKNCWNRRRRSDNTSGYKGVNWCKVRGSWVARIQADGKRLLLGCFDDPKEAARAYNKAALRYHGEYARLNDV